MSSGLESGFLRVFEETATGALFLFGGSTLATFLSAVCGIVVANLLGPELYGAYSLAFVIPSFLAVFTGLGVNSALTRYIAYYKSRGELDRVALLVKVGLTFTLAESLLVFAVAFFLLRELTVLLTNRPELVELAKVTLVLVVLQAGFVVASSVLLGFGDAKGNALMSVILQLFRALLAPLLVVLGFSVFGALVGNVLAYVAGLATGLLLVYGHYRKLDISVNQEVRSFKKDLSLMLNYGIPLYIASVIGALTDTFKSVILAYSASDFVIGNFNVALRFTTLITLLLAPLTSILFPAFSKLSGSSEDLKKMFTYSIKYSSLLIVPASIFVAVMSRELVIAILFTTKYTLAPWYLSLFALSYLYVGLGYAVLGSFFSGVGDPGVYFKATLVYTAVFVPLSAILTRLLSVEGLIASIVASNGASTLYALKVATVKYGVKPDYKSSLSIYLASALSAIPIALLALHIHSQSVFVDVVKLVAGALIYLFTYLTLTPLLGAINNEDVENLARIFAKIKPLKPAVKILVNYENKVLKTFSKSF